MKMFRDSLFYMLNVHVPAYHAWPKRNKESGK
jgi:hypothetical protein